MPNGTKMVLGIDIVRAGIGRGLALILGVLYVIFGMALLVSSREAGEVWVAYWWVRSIAMVVGYSAAYVVFRIIVLGIYHKLGGWVPPTEATVEDTSACP